MDFAWLHQVLVIYLALFGAALGSFAYVLVDRLPRLESIVWPGSHCDACGVTLAWYDNIPLCSYFLLKGACRSCGVTFAARSWLTELMAAALLPALYLQYGLTTTFWLWAPVVPLLLAIAWLDVDYWWIPDVLILPGLLWFVVVHLWTFSTFATLGWYGLGCLPAVLLWLIGWAYARLRGQEGLGGGDIKLLLWLGLGLGPSKTLYLLLWACWQGILVGLWLRLTKQSHQGKWQPGQIPAALADDQDWQPPAGAVPFGPFLLLACLQVLLLPDVFVELPRLLQSQWSEQLLRWSLAAGL